MYLIKKGNKMSDRILNNSNPSSYWDPFLGEEFGDSSDWTTLPSSAGDAFLLDVIDSTQRPKSEDETDSDSNKTDTPLTSILPIASSSTKASVTRISTPFPVSSSQMTQRCSSLMSSSPLSEPLQPATPSLSVTHDLQAPEFLSYNIPSSSLLPLPIDSSVPLQQPQMQQLLPLAQQVQSSALSTISLSPLLRNSEQPSHQPTSIHSSQLPLDTPARPQSFAVPAPKKPRHSSQQVQAQSSSSSASSRSTPSHNAANPTQVSSSQNLNEIFNKYNIPMFKRKEYESVLARYYKYINDGLDKPTSFAFAIGSFRMNEVGEISGLIDLIDESTNSSGIIQSLIASLASQQSSPSLSHGLPHTEAPGRLPQSSSSMPASQVHHAAESWNRDLPPLPYVPGFEAMDQALTQGILSQLHQMNSPSTSSGNFQSASLFSSSSSPSQIGLNRNFVSPGSSAPSLQTTFALPEPVTKDFQATRSWNIRSSSSVLLPSSSASQQLQMLQEAQLTQAQASVPQTRSSSPSFYSPSVDPLLNGLNMNSVPTDSSAGDLQSSFTPPLAEAVSATPQSSPSSFTVPTLGSSSDDSTSASSRGTKRKATSEISFASLKNALIAWGNKKAFSGFGIPKEVFNRYKNALRDFYIDFKISGNKEASLKKVSQADEELNIELFNLLIDYCDNNPALVSFIEKNAPNAHRRSKK